MCVRYLFLFFNHLLALLLISINSVLASEDPTAADLIEMQLEELVSMEIQVESAGKHQTKAFDLAYAAFVITNDDIKKYHLLTIPDALSLAPGVAVEQVAGAEWAVTIRGSGGRFSRFVLVLLNGRPLNNTIFSGVNWDELNISMTEIERIEVIRGPNADSWGANAVNGIINIITYDAAKSGRSAARIAYGEQDSHFIDMLLRVGNETDNYHHLALNYQQLPGFRNRSKTLVEDDSRTRRISYHMGKTLGSHEMSLNIAHFRSDISSYWTQVQLPMVLPALTDTNKDGYFAQLEWRYQKNNRTLVKTRLSYDETNRASYLEQWDSENFQADIDWQYQGDRHHVNLGLNLRKSNSLLRDIGGFPVRIVPDAIDVNYSGIYFSDTINLFDEKLTAKLAARLDNNSLTDNEFQPSLRLLWRMTDKDRFWFAVSEAASIPSAGITNAVAGYLEYLTPEETGQLFPLVVQLTQQQKLKNTRVSSVELGYRHLWENMNIDVSVFRFHYSDELQLAMLGEPMLSEFPPNMNTYLRQLVEFESDFPYDASGIEINYLAQLNEFWRLQLVYSYLDTENEIGVEHLLSFRSDFQINELWQLAFRARYSSGNELYQADNYDVYDLSLHYDLGNNFLISYTAKNIAKGAYEEGRREFFSPGIFLNEPRHILAFSWSF